MDIPVYSLRDQKHICQYIFNQNLGTNEKTRNWHVTIHSVKDENIVNIFLIKI